ncbi:hypothetical protein EKO27_g4657 [Xylaria grammica]|uniref:Hypervirulence associated protein TUDOR domain-containing protein n=1 Tax=Xylaria grammica TaxID=363999 RepID=A0A439D7T9_9PEZI|nr:hypothetical protein EKO27_g4657 [Xylaria grammica]
MTTENPEKGDKVSWNWGGGAPGGTVAETKDQGDISIKSKRGNTIKKNASPDNPAVHVERSGNDVVKRASELTVETKASENKIQGEDGGNSGSKRKAESQRGSRTDANEDENETEEADDSEDIHTINKQGNEVKRGGKDANKRQKVRQGGDGKSDFLKASENKDENGTVEEEEEEGEEEEDGGKEEVEKSQREDKAETPKNAKDNGTGDGDESPVAPPNDGDQVSTRTRSHDTAV